MRARAPRVLGLVSVFAFLLIPGFLGAQQKAPPPIVVTQGPATVPVLSPELRNVKPVQGGVDRKIVTNIELPHPAVSAKKPSGPDTGLQSHFGVTQPTPTGTNFDGIPANGFAPPDSNGRVGPNNYIEMINVQFAIYDKAGTLLYGPAENNTLFQALGPSNPCATSNDGDPIVVYDQLADRWILTQFVVGSSPIFSHQCAAISVTGDPLGAYYLYDFPTAAALFVDYPHWGVWPDSYYMTAHLFNTAGTAYIGQGLFAFERPAMLAGLPARFQGANVGGGAYGGALPTDLDGLTPPPPGSPNYVIAPGSPELDGSPTDVLHFFTASATWGGSPTFTINGPNDIATAPFNADTCFFSTGRACIPQPPPAGAGDYVDAISDRLMYRIAYRNIGGTESLVLNHTVNVGTPVGETPLQAGIRWYEIQSPASSPTIFQQGTFAPDTDNRWMGSIAMDNSGNMALGYSKSSTSLFPEIDLTGRLIGDPAGTMGSETLMEAGLGSQIGTGNRWGDYSHMSVDPRDGCSFWYINQYEQASGSFNWSTRIASFRFPSCVSPPRGTIMGFVTDAVTGAPIAGALVSTDSGFSGATDANGKYQIVLPPGSYNVTASADQRSCTPSASQVANVSDGAVVTLNFTLTGAPIVTLAGVLIDDSTGNNNGVINRDECFLLNLPLGNIGCSAATGVSATLTTSTPGVNVSQNQNNSFYPDIPAGGTEANAIAYKAATTPSFVCGTDIAFTLTVTSNQGPTVLNFSVPTCQAAPSVQMGSITGGDSQENSRMGRNATASTCAGKPCPGPLGGGTRSYDAYNFTNIAPSDRCITVTLGAACGAGSNGNVFSVGYTPTFDPTNLCLNYAGDLGASPFNGTSGSYSFDVPSGANFVVIVNESTAGVGCANYTLTVDGLIDNTDAGATDLSITKGAAPNPVTVGAPLTYTLTATNNGTNSASNVTVSDFLPFDVTFVSATPSQGSCLGTVFVTCNLGTLAGGANATITIVVNAPSKPEVISNFASISSSTCDTDSSNDSATVMTTVVSGSASPSALSVDGFDASGTSNINGVLEPGETVILDPSWSNTGAAPLPLTGSATSYTGPTGATYTINDGTADYGTIAVGTANDCHGATANCYEVSVSNPATRPQIHWDTSFTEQLSTGDLKTWTVHVGNSFTDVPVGSPDYKFVETILHNGVTAGCGGTNFCPGSNVTRQQMAVFLLVSDLGSSYVPPACTVPIFADVPCSSPFAPWVNDLFNRGITAGCGGGNYCPNDPVLREQMAVFLLRMLLGPSYNPPACTTPIFNDVPCSSPFAPWVNDLFNRGLTGGCGGGNFCPTDPVGRGQMAVFLTTTFSLHLYGP